MNPGLAAASCSAQDTIVSYLQIDKYLQLSITNYLPTVNVYISITSTIKVRLLDGVFSDAPPTVM